MSKKPVRLSAEEEFVWSHLSSVLRALPTALDTQLKRDSCLNHFEYSILAALADRPDRSMQMAALAQWVNGSPSRLSHATARLEKAGWVERRLNQNKVRIVEAVLTDAGHAKLTRSIPGHVDQIRRAVFDVLTPEEQVHLGDACRKILSATQPACLSAIDENSRHGDQSAAS